MSQASGGSHTPDSMDIDQLIQGLSDKESSNSLQQKPAEENGNDRRDECVAETNQEITTSERFEGKSICLELSEPICDSPYQSIGKDSRNEIALTRRDSVPTPSEPCERRRKTHNFDIKICEPKIEEARTDTSDEKQDETIQFGASQPTYEVKVKDVECAKEIGNGSFGRVIKLPFKGSDYCFMAVKISNVGIESMKWDNELKALQTVTSKGRCPYIIGFYGISLNSEKRPPCFFLEYMDTDLKKAYQKLHAEKLSSPKNLDLLLRRVAFNVVSALKFMSGHNISHNDVKPANILLDRKGNVKLADFGECDQIRDGEAADNISRGTRWYWPPECVKYPVLCSSQRFNLWALGITLLETILNKHPHPLNMGYSDFGGYLADWDPTNPRDKCSKECTDFIMKYLLPKHQEFEELIYNYILNSDYLKRISSEPSQEEISLFKMII